MMGLADQLKQNKPLKWHHRPDVLVGPQIPPPMHGLNPRSVFGREWWEATRQAAFKATDYHCVACGHLRHSREWFRWLEGHEVYDIDHLLGTMTYLETVPLCSRCHGFVHRGLLNLKADEGLMTRQEHAVVVAHGEQILKAAGLSLPEPFPPQLVARWEDWRMKIHTIDADTGGAVILEFKPLHPAPKGR